MYTKRVWSSHDSKFRIVEKYHSQKSLPKNPLIREKRAPRTGIGTTERQKKINLRQRADKLSRLIMDNFSVGDWYITFTCAVQPSQEDFERAYKRLLRFLRNYFKSKDSELRYIAVLENLCGKGRKHGHILIPNCADFAEVKKLLQRAWLLGTAYIKPYGGDAVDARRLASYFVKEDQYKNADKTENLDSQRGRLRTSLNLCRTEPKKTQVSAETYRQEIKAPKGYHVVLELSYNGWSLDGYPYQHAVFEKDDG